jgi:hypothetical protein
VPQRQPLPPALRRRLFLGSTAVRDGLLTERRLRSKRVRRVLRDVYADALLTVDHGVRIAAADLVLPDLVAIAGRSAAWLHGVRLAGPNDAVEVVAEKTVRRHPRSGVDVHTGGLPSTDVEQVGSLRVTTPARTCVDLARWYDEDAAITFLDAILSARLVTVADLDRQLAGSAGRGLVRAERLLSLADGRSESPRESVLRLRVIRAGLPPPEPQIEVWHNGTLVARVDLGWREARTALEYDGAWHGAPGQLAGDRRRLNALVAAGWTVIHVTAADLHDLSAVLAQVRQALRSAA